MMRLGTLILVIYLFIAFFVFGITFGTTFVGLIGVFFVAWGLLNVLEKDNRYNKEVASVKKIFMNLFLVGFVSFLFVQGLILSVKSDETVHVDYAIVLGAGLQGEVPSLTLTKRLDKGVEFLKKNPHVTVIVSGGQGIGETISEAAAMKKYLIRNGIAEDRIILEEKSTSSIENLLFSKQLLDEMDTIQSYKVIIITSDVH